MRLRLRLEGNWRKIKKSWPIPGFHYNFHRTKYLKILLLLTFLSLAKHLSSCLSNSFQSVSEKKALFFTTFFSEERKKSRTLVWKSVFLERSPFGKTKKVSVWKRNFPLTLDAKLFYLLQQTCCFTILWESIFSMNNIWRSNVVNIISQKTWYINMLSFNFKTYEFFWALLLRIFFACYLARHFDWKNVKICPSEFSATYLFGCRKILQKIGRFFLRNRE